MYVQIDVHINLTSFFFIRHWLLVMTKPCQSLRNVALYTQSFALVLF